MTVVASRGWSHVVVDEPLHREIVPALECGDAAVLRSLSRAALNSASSETLNRVTAAGGLEGLQVRNCTYAPLRRTPAGRSVARGSLPGPDPQR